MKQISVSICVVLGLAVSTATARAQSAPPQTPPAQQPPASAGQPQTPPAQAGQPQTPPPGGQTQAPPAQQQQAAAPSARSFTSDAGMFFNNVKPDKTADFEMVMGRVKEALARNPDPVRKQQAASWRIYKSVEPGVALPDGTRAVLYIFVLDPAVKNADYTITKILAEAFPSEVQELYNKLVACYPAQGGQSIVNLQSVLNMAGTAASGGR